VKHDHETLVDRFNHTGGHGVGGVLVAGTDPLPPSSSPRRLRSWPISSSITRAGMPASSSQVEKVCRKFGPPSGMASVGEVKVTGAGW
jgi:hypothetical protein